MKYRWMAACAMISILFLSSCAMLIGTRDVDFPLTSLQQSLNKRLPFEKRYLGLIEVTAGNAVLALDAKQGRLIIDMDVTLALPLTGKSWFGKLAMSGVVALDAEHNTVVVNNTRLDNITLANLDSAYSDKVTQIGGLLARELMQSVPLYSFKPEDLRFVGVTFVPTKIAIKTDHLVVTFTPQK